MLSKLLYQFFVFNNDNDSLCQNKKIKTIIRTDDYLDKVDKLIVKILNNIKLKNS